MFKVFILITWLLLSFSHAGQISAEEVLSLQVPGSPLNQEAASDRVQEVQFIPHLEMKSGTVRWEYPLRPLSPKCLFLSSRSEAGSQLLRKKSEFWWVT